MVSVSGIRGTIPNGLTPPILAEAVTAFGAITGKKIVLGWTVRTGLLIRYYGRSDRLRQRGASCWTGTYAHSQSGGEAAQSPR